MVHPVIDGHASQPAVRQHGHRLQGRRRWLLHRARPLS